MNPQIKQQWLAALKSGEYHQGRKFLRYQKDYNDTYQCYCCLGVLCDLAVKAGVTTWEEIDKDNDGDEQLTNKVSRWAGLQSLNPEISLQVLEPEETKNDNWTLRISHLNDGDFAIRPRNFDEIHDIIEKYL